MDPNAALAKAREALVRFEEAYREQTTEEIIAAEDLADAFEALDGWLSRGGFLPEGWAR